ncbi:efflux RND transporter periplasmic adaptor subunit [Butyricimonas virosa]|jgi:RND family efflux transporter MFP subunit|uniref:Efflux RND transporter periplasmic adaptor subunit n=2 Tax=Butyricimonas virosa TaxID=544645 RepID=A0A413IU21_9BACT|nr:MULTISPECIES: efflux RND transporter periplasmic adaptor subunit [Butyricimonas]MBO4958296.1 efflux RND transporter periplasmic adaptor subunit [Butyricimonas sp.]MBR5461621.1 efflux RND transporter periplasmic adaptor subunit [Butyricimonas sp.]MCI6413875.1 efflux RND transporter periplasmic adaptor subunit [Butyricimonas virosa]MCI7390796.1 efflux RND transporter periplasmic adaptor subunit [Butyricimonas virosa]MDY4903703.1 efflux RND transporter periplasmic adaptor subunit [Butyricimona
MRTIIYAITILAISLWGCKNQSSQDKHTHSATETHAGHDHSHEGHNHEHEGHDHEHETAEEHAGHNHESKATKHSDEIIFPKAQAAKTTFEVREIQPASFNQVVKTTGQVLAAPGDEAVIVATSNGVVSFSSNKLTEGTKVQKGQSLFQISSKDIAEGDYYTKVKATYEAAKASYDRAEALVKDKIISQKEFESTKLEFENAKTAYNAVSNNKTAKGVSVNAPINGHMKNILVKEGEYITVGQPLATVSQNQRLVLRAEVSQRYYNAMQSVKSANFKTPYDNKVYSLEDLNGRLLSFGKTSNENSFFIPVSFEFDNKGEVIPGSFVEVYLISSPIENTLSIPVSALTNEMGIYYVYVQIDEEGYRKQEVALGANNGKEVQIIKGLHPGDRVVTQGAYQVKMASASGAIPHGHSHEH